MKGFIEVQGGSVKAINRAGGGATFTIYLPQAEMPAKAAEAAAAASEPAARGRGYRVLVVEDNDDVGQFSTELLEETTPLVRIFEALRKRPWVFVLILGHVGGIVTRYKKSDITTRTQQKLSVMPAGLEQAISQEDLIALVEYLSSLKIPIPQPSATKAGP